MTNDVSERKVKCEKCRGDGRITVERRMTEMMASDAGAEYEAGMKIPDTVQCPACDGAGYFVEEVEADD